MLPVRPCFSIPSRLACLISKLFGAGISVLFLLLSGCTLGSITSLIKETNTDISYNLTKIELEEDSSVITSLNLKGKFAQHANSSTVGKAKDVYLKVTVYDVKPAPKKDFQPELKITGTTQITSKCGVTNDDGIAYCGLTSVKTGQYLVTLANANVKAHIEVTFYDDNNPVTVQPGTTYANGQDPVVIDVTVRTPNGEIDPGAVPQLTVTGPGHPQYHCTPADNNGVSKCYITNDTSGTVSVTFTNPLVQDPINIDFVTSSITPVDSHAHSSDNGGDASTVTDDGAKTTITVQLPPNPDGTPQSGTTPVLNVSPASNTSYVCEPSNASGVATCTITSTAPGDKTVSVTSPSGIDETVTVTFGDKYSDAIVTTPSGTQTPADGSSEQVVAVTIKDSNGNPIAGQTPQGTVTGAGNTTMTCSPSDANGVAECRVSSDTPGDKTVTFTDPAVSEPVTVHFDESNVSIGNNRAEAGTGDQDVITVITRDAQGNIITDTTPTLSITGPGETTYTCTPSNAQGESRCYISADTSGEYAVNVTSPAGSEQTVEILFGDYSSSAELTKDTAAADLVDSATLSLTIRNEQNLPRVGFTPTLKITGTGNTTANCPATGLLGGTDCAITSDTWGLKTVEVTSPLLKSRYVVKFINTFSTLTESAAGTLTTYANAPGAVAKVKVTLKKNATTPMSGVIPKLEITGPGTIKYDCDSSDTNGVAECRISSDTISTATVKIAEPYSNAAAVTATFLNKTRSCTVDFGNGDQTWTGPTFSDFGVCEHVTCDLGYTWSGGQCKEFDAPQGGDFAINGGAVGTNSSLVTLSITYPTDATLPLYMLASEDSSDNSSWEAISPTKSFTLSAGNGVKTIYMKFKDRFDNISAIVSHTIRMDSLAPVGGGFSIINNGNNVVGDPNVDVMITCPTDVSGGVQSATGEAAHPTNWVDCISSMQYLLTNVSGSHTMYMAFRDSLHNTTPDYTNSVILDITGPITTVSYTDGYLNNTFNTSVAVSAVDDFSAVSGCTVQYQETTISNGVLNTWSAWKPLTRTGNGCGTQGFTGALGKAYKFQARSVDEWGHVGNYNTPASILRFDNTPPASGGISNPTGNQTTTGITVTLNKGVDPESGMSAANASYALYYRQATNIDGNCQTDWSGWIGLSGLTAAATSYGFTGAQGRCYHFRYVVTNNAGLQSIYDTVSPSRIDYTYWWEISTGWYGCTAPQPNWYQSGFGGCSVGQPAWQYGGWSACGCDQMQYRSESCPVVYGTQSQTVYCPVNYGTEYRTVVCRRSDGAVAADAYCGGGKPATAQTCSRNDCPGGAPASVIGCSRGGGGDCYNRQGTSQSCYVYCGGDGGGDDGGGGT